MLKSNKHVFWEAFVITIVVFLLGLLVGVMFETGRVDEINDYFSKSEVSLLDIQIMQKLIDTDNIDCEVVNRANIEFANRIYNEAKVLAHYEEAGKITEGIKLSHKRYDLMRTLLWVNSIEANKKCGDNLDVVVYLYEYEPEDLTIKAKQEVWSNILYDLKEESGNDIVLIPIAYNNNITTLDVLVENLGVEIFPVVIINNEHIINNLISAQDLQKYLN